MTDDIAGVFDDITPDHFAPNQGQLAFDSFVAHQIETVRYAFLASRSQINPVATLTTPSETRFFTPTESESLAQYCERLKVHAADLGATWLFITRMTTVGVTPVDVNDIRDIADPGAMTQAVENGTAVDGLYYYAERIDGGRKFYRHGIMQPVAEDRLGPPIEGPIAQPSEFFGAILS